MSTITEAFSDFKCFTGKNKKNRGFVLANKCLFMNPVVGTQCEVSLIINIYHPASGNVQEGHGDLATHEGTLNTGSIQFLEQHLLPSRQCVFCFFSREDLSCVCKTMPIHILNVLQQHDSVVTVELVNWPA